MRDDAMRYLVLSYDLDGAPFMSGYENLTDAEALAREAAAEGMSTFLFHCLRRFEPAEQKPLEEEYGVCAGRDFPGTLYPAPQAA